MSDKPTIICLTPVKNEAWILDVFLKCTSLWADHIIIADQNSTDGSIEIAKKFEKVTLIKNNSLEYNEYERQKLLINEARKIKGKKLLITLDADEVFTSGFMETEEWHKILHGDIGDVFGFEWINIMPGCKKAWINEGPFPWAIIDDGSEHTGKDIHSPRIPLKQDAQIIPIKKIKVLHLQYLNWQRMDSKHYYYQCLERIKYPNKTAVEIYRMYHHMYAISKDKLTNFEQNWVADYKNQGIHFDKLPNFNRYWFDDEVEKLFVTHGSSVFKREAIWQSKWSVKDPRSIFDKMIHVYLKLTQPLHLKNTMVKKIDRQLKFHYK